MTKKNGKPPKKSPVKTQAKTQAKKKRVPTLVVQAHGGALWSGPMLHPVAGPGRPPSVIRDAFRESLADRRGILEEIADDKTIAPADRTRAVDVIGKYGLGSQGELTVVSPDVRARLSQTLAAVRDALPTEQAESLLDRLGDIWR